MLIYRVVEKSNFYDLMVQTFSCIGKLVGAFKNADHSIASMTVLFHKQTASIDHERFWNAPKRGFGGIADPPDQSTLHIRSCTSSRKTSASNITRAILLDEYGGLFYLLYFTESGMNFAETAVHKKQIQLFSSLFRQDWPVEIFIRTWN